jgi:hypothetical protein
MGATSDNYLINTDGITYTISSDYVNNAHHQLVKIVTGTGDKVQYINSDTPLSAGLCGSWDRYEYLSSPFYSIATTIVGYTGNGIPIVGVCGAEAVNVSIIGSVGVTGEAIAIRALYGGAIGAAQGSMTGIDYVSIQGICGGYPVGMTFAGDLPITINSLADHGVYGVSGGTAIGVTFGVVNFRGITAATDTITVYGGGTASTVSVGLFGFTGATASPIYADNNALNVNVKSFDIGINGVTVTAADLDIRNLGYVSDSVTVVGQGAADDDSKSTVPTYINALVAGTNMQRVGGVTGAGWCAAALNVYLVNNGVTFTVSASATFGTTLGVTSASNAGLFVQGTTYAYTGIWVAGGTNGEPVQIKGFSGGFLPVELNNFTTQTTAMNSNLADIRTFTQFLIATKKALYSDTQSVGALDFSDSASLYTLLRDNLGSSLQSLKDSVMPNSTLSTLVESSQKSVAVSVVATKQQPSFLSRTNFAGLNAKNLNEFNGGSGYTCASGVRIKASRVATGASASSNEFMCIISEADAALYGATAGNCAYTLYHGEEIFVEIDNINKLRVFYPAYSASFAPHNTGAGVTFSFYAS